MRAGFLLAGLLAGCYPDRQWTCDAQVPPPAGTLTHQLFDTEAAKGRADHFVIYLNEWYMGGTTLGPYGKYHLDQIAQRLAAAPSPVVIQPTPDPALNEVRQLAVVRCLAEHGIPDPAKWVVLTFPQAEGLYGECEAERAYIWMLHPPYFTNPYGFLPYGGYNGFNGFRGY